METDTGFTATAAYKDGDIEKKDSETVKINKSEDPTIPTDSTGPTLGGNPETPNGSDTTDKTSTGGTDTGNSSSESGDEDAQNGLTTEKVEITKEAHPIRKWFSSLFK